MLGGVENARGWRWRAPRRRSRNGHRADILLHAGASDNRRELSLQTTDAPDHQVATYQFESFTAYWEHRRFAGTGPEKSSVGCHFYGTKGTFHMGWRDGWTFYPADEKKSPIHQKAVHKEPDGHSIDLLWADFVDAIETGQRPTCDVQIGHDATNMSLLGMLSLKLGRSIQWDGAQERVVGDDEANRLLSRPYENGWSYPGTA
ncbi:MAG: hypothetical protein ACPGPS_12595 [Rubripirellula sp.]